MRAPRLFVGRHNVGNGQVVFPTQLQQHPGTAEWVWLWGVILAHLQGALNGCIHHEPTADRIIAFLEQALPVAVESLTGHAVGVLGKGFAAVIDQVGILTEFNGLLPCKQEGSTVADLLKTSRHYRRVDLVWSFTFQSHHYRRAGAMPLAGGTERPVKGHLEPTDRRKQTLTHKRPGKSSGRLHGSHCVGTGGANTNLEQLKQTDCQCVASC